MGFRSFIFLGSIQGECPEVLRTSGYIVPTSGPYFSLLGTSNYHIVTYSILGTLDVFGTSHWSH